MNKIFNIIVALAIMGGPGRTHGSPRQQCPLITLRDLCPVDGKSTCWSPGENDIDCPNNGLCCFDGCFNTCGIPPVLHFPEEPELPCEPTYVTQEETVEDVVCNSIQGPEECVKVTIERCVPVCDTVEEAVTVYGNEHCCSTTPELECNPVSCYDETRPVVTPFKKEVCRQTEKQCFTVPEQVCDGEEQVCQPQEELVCKEVQGEPTKECTTKWEEECHMVPKYVCPQNPHKGKLHGHKFTKGCQYVNVQECHTVPWQMCNDVYPEPTTVCDKVVTEKCKTKTVCRMIEREVCNEPSEEICETVLDTTEETTVNAHCANGEDTYDVCSFVDKTVCNDKPSSVVKYVPKRVCSDSCQPLTSMECAPGAPVEKCETVVKRMFYEVPVQKC